MSAELPPRGIPFPRSCGGIVPLCTPRILPSQQIPSATPSPSISSVALPFARVRAVTYGIGLSIAEHSVKVLRVALSDDPLGGGVSEHGMLPGYGISFHFSRERVLGHHPHTGTGSGTFLGRDQPREENHGESCRERLRGVSTNTLDFTGVNLKPHDENYAEERKHLPSICNMRLKTSTSTLINELEKRSMNRESWEVAGRGSVGHPGSAIFCGSAVWMEGVSAPLPL